MSCLVSLSKGVEQLRRKLLDVAACLQWRCAALRSPAQAGQSHPGSEAGEAGRSVPALPSHEAALEACWLGGRLEAGQLGSSGSRKRGCEQIVKFIQAFFFLKPKQIPPWGPAVELL